VKHLYRRVFGYDATIIRGCSRRNDRPSLQILLRAGPIEYLTIDNRSLCRCRRDVALRLDDSLSAGNRRQRVRILTDGSSMTA
jgi:hypothetical protein